MSSSDNFNNADSQTYIDQDNSVGMASPSQSSPSVAAGSSNGTTATGQTNKPTTDSTTQVGRFKTVVVD